MKAELLAPAGSKESFYKAIAEGADAVYLGLKAFSARASAENFEADELPSLISYAHFFGVKVYVALNTIIKENELEEFAETAGKAIAAGADALILQDIFLGKLIKDYYPDAELHLSTQAGVNNVYGARVAKEYGFSRVILARETGLKEIKEIAAEIETEVFVQGALCSSFSGQCYFSSFIGGMSGNRGKCKQPCRKEYTLNGETKYALSLADLCVGERIFTLLEAGVSSFKIEGRLRRTEYVAAAVSYYRHLLDGNATPDDASKLKRTYNRGDYTSGLAFGQDKRFISSAVQGHVGEAAGTVISVKGNRITVKGSLIVHKGDGFKILRKGKEVGSAVADEVSGNGETFVIKSRDKLLKGDQVRITTDVKLNEELLRVKATREISVTVRVAENRMVYAAAEYLGHNVSASASEPLPEPRGHALTAEELTEIFMKTDTYPYSPKVEIVMEGSVFAPRAALNALRRELYAALMNSFSSEKEYREIAIPKTAERPREGQKVAVIAEDFSFAPNLPPFTAVFAPEDYNDENAFRKFFADTEGCRRYLYLPAFLNAEDEKIIEKRVSGFDGIYGENLAAIALKKKYGLRLMAGTGFNISNSVDAQGVSEVADEFCASKEIALRSQMKLPPEVYNYARGDIKVMDLIYCPHGKNCADCKGEHVTSLDERRGVVLRRYRLSECRFEVYNPYIMFSSASGNRLYNFMLRTPKEAEFLLTSAPEAFRERYSGKYTAGHSNEDVL